VGNHDEAGTDLGAIVTDNQGHDLGYKTFLNGTLASNSLIDTTQAATDTIDYVATDTWGNTATSTRTVIIEASPAIPRTKRRTAASVPFAWRQLPARPQGAPTSCKDCMLQRVCHCS
jgi:hypothetical protein